MRSEGFSCSLDVIQEAQKRTIFSAVKLYCTIFVYQNTGSESGAGFGGFNETNADPQHCLNHITGIVAKRHYDSLSFNEKTINGILKATTREKRSR